MRMTDGRSVPDGPGGFSHCASVGNSTSICQAGPVYMRQEVDDVKGFRSQICLFLLIAGIDLLLALNLARTAEGWGEAGAAGSWEEAEGWEEAGMAGKEPALPASEAGEETPDRANQFLALTFDDGPHPICTKALLDGLRERNVKASFFLLGENIPGNEPLIRQMKEDGHLIGTHCYRHVDLTKEDTETAISMIRRTNRELEAVTGDKPVYIRPPYGKWNGQLEEALDMTPVLWDIDTLDWKVQNSEKVLRTIEKNAGKHQIVLMHDIFPTTVDAALAAIDTLGEQGYTFVTVDELLID